jgi:hypothetical protein
VFGRRTASQTEIERRLRAERPSAPQKLVATIVARIEQERPAQGVFTRLGLALATIGVVVIVFASLGGVGYASSAASQVFRKLETVTQSKPKAGRIPAVSAGQAQYGPVPVPPYPPPRPTPPPTPTPPPPPTPKPTPPPSGGKGSGGTKGQTGGQSGTPGSTTGVAGAGHSQTPTPTTTSGLPFTGLSLLFPVLLGIGLVAGGIFLRRRARRLPE